MHDEKDAMTNEATGSFRDKKMGGDRKSVV